MVVEVGGCLCNSDSNTTHDLTSLEHMDPGCLSLQRWRSLVSVLFTTKAIAWLFLWLPYYAVHGSEKDWNVL
jgi:hypothetical protein